MIANKQYSSSEIRKVRKHFTESEISNMLSRSYDVPESEYPRLERKLNNLKNALEGTGSTFNWTTEVIPPVEAENQDWLTAIPIPQVRVTITAEIKDDEWEVVGTVTRQKAGLTLNTVWSRNVVIPESFYKRVSRRNAGEITIECDHCKKLKAGKTQRNAGVIVHKIGTSDATDDEANLYDNFKLIGNTCVDKFTKIPFLLIDQLIKTLESLNLSEKDKYASVSKEDVDRRRFNLNIHAWLVDYVNKINYEKYSSTSLIQDQKKIVKHIQDLLAGVITPDYTEDVISAVAALEQELLSKQLIQRDNYKNFEALHNAQVLVKSGAIRARDASYNLFENIMNAFFSSDVYTIHADEMIALALMTDERALNAEYVPYTEIHFAEKNTFGDKPIYLVKNYRESLAVKCYHNCLTKADIPEILEWLYNHPEDLDLNLFEDHDFVDSSDVVKVYPHVMRAIRGIEADKEAAEAAKKAAELKELHHGYVNGDRFDKLDLTVESQGYASGYYVQALDSDSLRFRFETPEHYSIEIGDHIALVNATVIQDTNPSYLKVSYENCVDKEAEERVAAAKADLAKKLGNYKIGDTFEHLIVTIKSANSFIASSGKKCYKYIAENEASNQFYFVCGKEFKEGDKVDISKATYQEDKFKTKMHEKYINLGWISYIKPAKIEVPEPTTQEPSASAPANLASDVAKLDQLMVSPDTPGDVKAAIQSILNVDGTLKSRGSYGVIKNYKGTEIYNVLMSMWRKQFK